MRVARVHIKLSHGAVRRRGPEEHAADPALSARRQGGDGSTRRHPLDVHDDHPEPGDAHDRVTDEPPKLNVVPNQQRGRGRGAVGAPAPPPLSITWSKYRGPGQVTFAAAKPLIDGADGGKAATTATFSEPGDYILRMQANDQSGDGGGGLQGCWSNAHVAVTVKPGVTTTGGVR